MPFSEHRSSEPPRWQRRFENFDRALQSLQLAVRANHDAPENTLFVMALIKAFEMTYELGWKTLKDYLKYGGIDANLPRDVIKEAFSHDLIQDGQAWINMLDDRNLMAHTYSQERANVAVDHIIHRYLKAIEDVHRFFSEKLTPSQ